MNLFPGNILIIDDQFNLCYHAEPDDALQKTQWANFRMLKNLFDNNGFCYSVITDVSNIETIQQKIIKYQNIRLLILDLDLNESGEVEEDDSSLVKLIIEKALKSFGYFFLAINSSYAEKWDDIKNEMISTFEGDEVKNARQIHFLKNFCISLNKSVPEIEDQLLNLLSDKFSNELITQFEAYLNDARDKALGPFLDFNSKTWEQLYSIIHEDVDSHAQVNLTINGFLLGLLRQHMISATYSIPNVAKTDSIDESLHQRLIQSFNYTVNINQQLNTHPVWTGNLYFIENNTDLKKYVLIITPECDIAQLKGNGYIIIYGFEVNLPKDYKPEDYKESDPPYIVAYAGKKNGQWKSKNEIKDFYKGQGFYALQHGSITNKHIILDFRTVATINTIDDNYKLTLRVNEPIITDIMDKFSLLFNRKGVPRITPKNYFKLE